MIRYGLLGAGPVHRYFVAGLPRLSQELDWVAASNRRSASRIVNTLRAGRAGVFEDLNELAAILVCAPGGHGPVLLQAVEQSKIEWRGKVLVLCNCVPFSRELRFYRDAGASVASLRSVEGLANRFVLEGDREALKLARYVVHQCHGKPVEIRPEDHEIYSAAITLSSSMFTPLLDGCVSAIRSTGFKANPVQFVEALFLHRLRTFLYSGRKSWFGTVAGGDPTAIKEEIDALTGADPALGMLYRETGIAAARYLGRGPALNHLIERLHSEEPDPGDSRGPCGHALSDATLRDAAQR